MTIPWKSWGVIAALLVLATAIWTYGHRQLAAAVQGRDAAELALKQQIVAKEEARKQLQGTVSDLLTHNAQLQAAYDQAVLAAPSAKVISTARLDTGPLPVQTPLVPRGAVQEGGVVRVPPPSPSTSPSLSDPTVCAVTSAQHLSVAVEQVALESSAGSVLIVGTAAVYVEDPVRALLARGPFRSVLSDTHELAAPPAPRWGAMALGACGSAGCGPGAALLLPPFTLPLVHWRAESLIGIAAPGTLVAMAGLGVRW